MSLRTRFFARARALIDANEGKLIVRFDEFGDVLNEKGAAVVSPFNALLSGFELGAKPILWIRLVAYANACNELVKLLGGPEFVPHVFPTEDSLKRGGDPFILSHLPQYLERIKSVQLVQL